MFVQGLCFVLLFTPLGCRINVELIQRLADELSFTCITVIVENVDEITMRGETILMKTIPTVVLDLDDLEKINKLVKKGKKKCLNFVITSNFKLQVFLSSLTGKYSTILEDSTWYFWQSNESVDKFGYFWV